jgi:alpha-1,2-mannosyltransferase
VILLAASAAGARDLDANRDIRAGLWFGLATALKLFPGLLLVYLAWRRRWRAVIAAAALGIALTVVPLLALGLDGAVDTTRTWLDLSAAGVPVHRLGNQSLPEVMTRLGAPALVAQLLRVAILVITGWLLARPRPVWAEVALVTLAAVLLSPIAWWYYFALAYPAWVTVLAWVDARTQRGSVVVLAAAALFMCGILGPRALGLPILSAGVFLWGALSLYGVVAWRWRTA